MSAPAPAWAPPGGRKSDRTRAAIVSAASLAISWSTPACRQFEIKPLRDVAQHELVSAPVTHENGWMPQPQGPGLGIEVLEDVVERFRLD